MDVLSNEELMKVNGGAISAAVVAGIVAAGIFIIGVIDGILRPLACHK